MITDVMLDNDCQEECIIQEIDKGISFSANEPSMQQQLPDQRQQKQLKQPQQQQQQQQQQAKQPQQVLLQQPKTQPNVPNVSLVIKSENKKVQPCSLTCNVNLPQNTQIKNELSISAPTQCMVISSGVQQPDQKPVILQNVQTLKLPLPRNAKQNPMIIQQFNSGIPLQTVLPVATTQPQIHSVNLVSSTGVSVLKPGIALVYISSHFSSK